MKMNTIGFKKVLLSIAIAVGVLGVKAQEATLPVFDHTDPAEGADVALIGVAKLSYTDVVIGDYFDPDTKEWIDTNDGLAVKVIGQGTSLYSQTKAKTTNAVCVSFTVGTLIQEISSNAFSGWSALKTFTINTKNPPVLGDDVFPSNLEKIVVPEGTGNDYRVAPGWSAYSELIDDGTTELPTVVREKRNRNFEVAGRTLRFGGEKSVVVYDMTGKKVFDGVSSRVFLQPGLYVVAVDGKSCKVALR